MQAHSAAPPESAPELSGGYGLCTAHLGLFSSCPVGEFRGELWGQPGVQGCREGVSPREEQVCGGITGQHTPGQPNFRINRRGRD